MAGGVLGRRSHGAVAWEIALVALPVAVGLWYWFGLYLPRIDPHLTRDFASVDLYAYFLPGYLHAEERLAAGELPLWNPFEAFGMPFLATAQVAVFYPPRLLAFVIAGPEAALHAYVCFHLALGAVLYYLLGRARGRAPLASVLAAVVFVSGLHFAAGPAEPPQIASLALLPAVLLCAERVFLAPGRGAVALLAIVAALEFLAGYPELMLNTGVALAASLLLASAVRGWKCGPGEVASGWGRLALAGLLALALCAFQLVPFVEMVGESWRAAASSIGHGPYFVPSLNLRSPLPGRVSRQFFIGGLPLVLAVLGALRIERGRLPLGVGAAFCLAAGSFLWPWVHALPLLRLSRTGMTWGMIYGVFAPVLAADGLDWVWGGGAGRSRVVRLVALLGAGLWVVAVAGSPLRIGGLVPIRSLVATRILLACAVGAAVAGVLSRGLAVRLVAVGVMVAATLSDLWGMQPRRSVPPLVPQAIRDPVLARRVAPWLRARPGWRPRLLAPALTRTGGQLLAGIEAATGYQEFLMPARTRVIVDRFGLYSVPRLGGTRWGDLAKAKGLRQAIGLGAALLSATEAREAAASGLVPAARVGGRWLLLSRAYGQRVRLLHRAREVADAEAALAALTSPGFDPARTAIVEGPPPPLGTPAAGQVETVRITRYREEEVVVRARVAVPALLVLFDAFYPGWEATVDGAPRRIRRADYLFRAVALGPGDHEVRFRYRPRSFRVGVGLSAAGLGVLLVLAAGARRSRARGR